MSAAPQQTQQQAQAAHTPSASASTDSSATAEELSWEGDRMFNIYIWDYCVKRGYTNTARELAEEAKLNPNPRPPIDAKQGLLYEWWSVFWLLFSAKSNSQGPEDAMVYIQNHVAQSRMPQIPGAIPRFANGLRSIPGGPGTIPNSLGAGVPPHPGHPNQSQNAHPMPNGIGPTGPGQQPAGQPQGLPQQQAPGQQHPPQAPPSLGFPPHAPQQQPQPNGIPGHGRPPMQGQPGRPPMPFYQSPTMAHQQPGGATVPYPGPGPMVNAGMPPNMYSQPHMRSGMLPPGAPNGVGGATAGSPGFSQGNVGTGSRAPTPAQPSGSSITQPSPSMAHRTVAATPPSFGGPSGMSVPGGQRPPFDQQVNQLNAEISKIDTATINELRQELRLGNKDTLAMSIDEKAQLVNAFKSRNVPGPSNPVRVQQGRGSKRNSVSPGDEHAEIPAKDEPSPPGQKRQRRSPEQAAPSMPGPAPSAPPGGASNPSPAGTMFPPNMMPNGLRQGPPFTPQMNAMGQMPPHGMMMPQGSMMQQMPQFQKNPGQPFPGMQPMPKIGAPDSQQGMQQPQFGSDPNQGRPGPPPFGVAQRPNINQQGKMLPPNSPATSAGVNGQAKPPNAQGKPEVGGKVDSSPRNVPPPPPSGLAGRSPPTHSPGQPGATGQSPSLTTQSRPTTSTSNPPGSGTPVQTPVSQVPPPPPASAPPTTAPADSMNFDFMSTGFDDFTSMFGRDDNIDFEREFGMSGWFGGADITGMTDLK